MIEDIIPLRDVEVSLRVGRRPKKIYLAPQREPLAFSYKSGRVRFTVPKIEMSQIVAIE